MAEYAKSHLGAVILQELRTNDIPTSLKQAFLRVDDEFMLRKPMRCDA